MRTLCFGSLNNSKTTFVTVNQIAGLTISLQRRYSKTTFVTVNQYRGDHMNKIKQNSKTTFVTVNLSKYVEQ